MVAATLPVAPRMRRERRSKSENRSSNGRDAGEIVESNGRAGKKFFALDNFTLKKVDFKRFFGYYIKDGVLFRRVDRLRLGRQDRLQTARKRKIGEKKNRRVRSGAPTTGSKERE